MGSLGPNLGRLPIPNIFSVHRICSRSSRRAVQISMRRHEILTQSNEGIGDRRQRNCPVCTILVQSRIVLASECTSPITSFTRT
jgi:hypothetical protein